MDTSNNMAKGEMLVDLLRVEVASLPDELKRAQRGVDVRHAVEQRLRIAGDRYMQALPIACEAPATNQLRLLGLSVDFLDACSYSVQPMPEQASTAAPVQPQELSAARPVRLGGLVVLLIALLALLSTSWLAGFALLVGLLLFAIELTPYLLALRSELSRRLDRWQPWKGEAAAPTAHDMRSPIPLEASGGSSAVHVRWDGAKIAATLTAMAAVIDEGVATWMETLERRPAHAAPSHNGVDPELIVLLQYLLRDSQQSDPRYMRERIQRIPDVLKAQGLRLLRFEDLPVDAALDEYFQVFVDPSVDSIVTVLPAVVGEDGVVAEGRLIVAHHSVLSGGWS